MLAASCAIAAPPVVAQDTPSAARTKRLEALRTRIEGLQRDLEEKETVRREVRDALRESERAISDANRALARLAAEARGLHAQTQRHADRRKQLETALHTQQAVLDRLIAVRHRSGAPDALRVVLSGQHPGEVARRLVYLAHASRATLALAETIRRNIAERDAIHRDALQRAERLATIESAQRADRARLLAKREERRRVLQKAASEIRVQTRRIRVLRADEARLARLVEALGRVLSGPPERPDGAASVPVAAARSFSGLQGRLRPPVRGEPRGIFATQTSGAKSSARGIFIRAGQGQPVHAIADGQVVFADWLRGFGNVLILDHGEAYLSIYGNNESLLKQLGEPAAGGETVATVGASGGGEETGLYFELRRQGKPLDPRRWITPK